MKTIRIEYNQTEGKVPFYGSELSSGADLRAFNVLPITLEPNSFALVPTGLRISLPKGYDAQIRSRSGLAAKHGVFVLNTPGTIDNDYTGEIKVVLFNTGEKPFTVQYKDRVAQIVFSKVIRAKFVQKENLKKTKRGFDGFGSTGFKG